MSEPRLVVFSTLFPHPGQPNAGVFIRERMFRVGHYIPLVVVAPIPWFPFLGLIRKFRPHYRPEAPREEEQQGYKVYHPRFFSIPGLFKFMDGIFMALGSYGLMLRLKHEFRFNIIDAHFAYPDGKAAILLKRWLHVRATITLRGTEIRHSKTVLTRMFLIQALKEADHILSVSNSLKQHAVGLGISPERIQVVGNGVDTTKFYMVNKEEARRSLGIPQEAKVLITVGGLCERKGYHRVLEIMPDLLNKQPNLHYLIVGGASSEGDWTKRLKKMVRELELENHVHFLGIMSSEKLNIPLSSADVFVLATRNEGWANVILEAMSCGLPVVATDVGGNAEVIADSEVGITVPFDDAGKLYNALVVALYKKWDHDTIISYACENSWDSRVDTLRKAFQKLMY